MDDNLRQLLTKMGEKAQGGWEILVREEMLHCEVSIKVAFICFLIFGVGSLVVAFIGNILLKKDGCGWFWVMGVFFSFITLVVIACDYIDMQTPNRTTAHHYLKQVGK